MQLHQKVNLFTLNIRDKELAREYNEARTQHFWSYLLIADVISELIFLLMILSGSYNARSLFPAYLARSLSYSMQFILYVVSKSRPQVKNFVSVIIAILYNLFFNYAAFHLVLYGKAEELPQFFSIYPLAQVLTLLRVMLIHQTNFWTVGYIVIPIYILFYRLQMHQFDFNMDIVQQ